MAGKDLKEQGSIGYRARKDAHMIQTFSHWDHTIAANASIGGLKPNNSTIGSWTQG
jgi:hypothetical protein